MNTLFQVIYKYIKIGITILKYISKIKKMTEWFVIIIMKEKGKYMVYFCSKERFKCK